LLDPFLESLPPEVRVLRTRGPELTRPLFPLLDWIREEGERQGLDWDQFLGKLPLLTFHKPLFLAFFRNQPPQRQEEIIPEEFNYEQQRLQDRTLPDPGSPVP